MSASSTLSGGRWTINADVDAAQVSETIVVEQSPDNDGRLRVVINGTELDSRAARRVKSITINAGNGDDTVTVQLPAALSQIVVTINGGAGDDTLNAGSNRAILRGGADDDLLNGSASNDQLFGGIGNDVLNGNGGNDLLQGDDGDDSLAGGVGDDRLRGGRGTDRIYSSPGTDNIVSDDDDVIDAPDAGGIQQFDTIAAFEQWLAQNVDQTQSGYYGPIYTMAGGSILDVARSDGPSAAGESHSDTNTQVNGVDEQDIVETDGDYIYTVRGSQLLIIDVRDSSNPTIVSSIYLSGWGSEMYLDGDRLTVISTVNHLWQPYPLDEVQTDAIVGDVAGLRFAYPGWGWRPQTQVTTYDISDRANLKVLEDTTLDGSVSTSRSVDGRIYLVVNNSLWFRPYWYGYAELDVQTIDINAKMSPSFVPVGGWPSVLPTCTTKSYDADGNVTTTTGSLLEAPNIWTTDNPFQNSSLLTIAMFDVHHGDAGIDQSSSVYGLYGEVYASQDALYVASTDYPISILTNTSVYSGPITSIYKFDLNPEGSKLVATGKVDGTIINSFAMDEHGGYFRIATTSNMWQTTRQSSNVFILQQQGDDLVTISSLTGLSPTEQIQSARFVDDHLYMSTFLRIDPLLAIDLSDPAKPVVTGELEVPGFSTYLQQWGDHFLISIGQDADPQTGMVTGLQLSMFDTSGDTPVLIDTYRLNLTTPWDTYSQAQWEHHAFSLFDAEGILAIPVSRWASNSDHSTELDVFQLDGVSGFKLLGAVQHESEVVRSLRIGDELFSLSDSGLKVNVLTDPATAVGEVEFPVDPPIIVPGPIFLGPPITIDPIPIDPPVTVKHHKGKTPKVKAHGH